MLVILQKLLIIETDRIFIKKLIIINSDYDTGGASYIARNLYLYAKEELKNHDVSIYFITGRKSSLVDNDNNVIIVNNRFQLIGNVLAQRLFANDYIFSKKKWEKILRKNFDYECLVHLHNIHGYYFPLNNLIHFQNVRTIWTVHDFWATTGNCGSPKTCKEILNNCDNCPHPEYYPSTIKKHFQNTFLLKRKLFSEMNDLTVVTPSNYVRDTLKKNNLRFSDIRVITGGVDVNCYYPNDNLTYRQQTHKKLGIKPTDKVTFCFSARKLVDINKGFPILVESMQYVSYPFRMIIIGEKPMFYDLEYKDIEIIFTGYINDKTLIADYYRISDWFISLSKSETFGLNVMEALSCGLKLLLTAIPVFTDNLEDRAVFLKDHDPSELAERINNIIEGKLRPLIPSIDNVDYIKSQYSLDKMINQYFDLYLGKLGL